MRKRKVSQQQEKSVAKIMNGKTVVASGALWSAKGDVRNEHYLVECKTTAKDYYTITSKVWEKICKESLKDGMRDPLLIIDLHNNHKERYVCFPYNLLGGVPLEFLCLFVEKKQFKFTGGSTIRMFSFYSSNKKYMHKIMVMPYDTFVRIDKEYIHKGNKYDIS